jgi:hypothetical protein
VTRIDRAGTVAVCNGGITLIEAEIRLALRLVGAVARKTVVGEDRPDFPVEIDRRTCEYGA